MSTEHIQVVRRLYNECWAATNFELAPEVLDPEIVWTAIESAPDAGTRRGHAEAVAYMKDWAESFDFAEMPVDAVKTTLDRRLVCALHGTGTSKASGLTTEIHYGGVFRFAPDGRIAEIREYATVEEALEAAELGT